MIMVSFLFIVVTVSYGNTGKIRDTGEHVPAETASGCDRTDQPPVSDAATRSITQSGHAYERELGIVIGIGLEYPDLEDLNRDLEDFTYTGLDPAFLSLRAAISYLRRHILLETAVQGYSSVQGSRRPMVLEKARGAVAEASLGYRLYAFPTFSIFPVLGLGVGATEISVRDRDRVRDRYEIATVSLFFAPAFSIRGLLGASPRGSWDIGSILELRLGYRFSFDWTNTVETVPGSYVTFGGFYLYGAVGLGAGK